MGNKKKYLEYEFAVVFHMGIWAYEWSGDGKKSHSFLWCSFPYSKHLLLTVGNFSYPASCTAKKQYKNIWCVFARSTKHSAMIKYTQIRPTHEIINKMHCPTAYKWTFAEQNWTIKLMGEKFSSWFIHVSSFRIQKLCTFRRHVLSQPKTTQTTCDWQLLH